MRQRNNIAEASAEMLLNYLYPEVERKWIAHGEGRYLPETVAAGGHQ